jgi:uncharacterized protein (TIGR02687 family)
MKEKIEQILTQSFSEFRLVFWYDDKSEMKSLFESIELEGVNKIQIENNEFGIKYRVLIQEPEKKFLIYQSSPKPPDEENWLLDLILANKEFKTEPASLHLQELGLTTDLNDVINEHIEFFNNQKRVTKLKELLSETESKDSLKLKMIATICNSEIEFDKILFSLFSEILDSYTDSNELFKNKYEKYNQIDKFNLGQFFWNKIKALYNYTNPSPSIKDFVIELLSHNLFYNLKPERAKLNNEANILISHWKEHSKYLSKYKEISKKLSKEINLESVIQVSKIEDILNKDTFNIIDQRIIVEIRNLLVTGNFVNKEIQDWISERTNKFFYSDFENVYQGLSIASNLIDSIQRNTFQIESISQGINKYVNTFYLVDKYYRQYTAIAEKLNDGGIFKDLTEKIEKLYSNSFLLKLNDNWQKEVDKLDNWKFSEFKMQSDFYKNYVKEYENRNNRIFVIISDALRFEIGQELAELIVKEDRYEAELEFQVTTLPSYTQLGMAALLPHSKLSFDNENEYVNVDGMSSTGKDNRVKILQKYYQRSVALSSEEFLNMKAHTDGREFIKPYDIIYIYSNTIDKTGDNKDSENRTFFAVEEELQNILKLLKQIANVNGTNMIITADHGFIYQHKKLEETDFTEFTAQGKVYKINRRFVIGKNLDEDMSVKKFTSSQLGLDSDKDFLIPKSINRIRVQGAGSRFVHGGASLQEIIIPIVKVNKKRQSDISKVEVDLIMSGTKITSNRVNQSFYQKELVGEKVLKRTLKIAFYSSTNELISDVYQKDFDNSNKDEITKEIKHIFTLTNDISRLKDKEIKLKLEEPIEDTTQYRLYKEYNFSLALSFYNEFED